MSVPPRTTEAAVANILVNDLNPDLAGSSLDPYIATASAIIDTVVTNSLAQAFVWANAVSYNGSLNNVNLELIERWLSAHCYMVMQEQYQNRGGEGVRAVFTGKFGEALEQTWYGQMAIASDPSGVLYQIGTIPPKRARLYWDGSPSRFCGS